MSLSAVVPVLDAQKESAELGQYPAPLSHSATSLANVGFISKLYSIPTPIILYNPTPFKSPFLKI